MSANGLNSIQFFQIRQRGIIKVGQLSRTQLAGIKRVIKNKDWIPWIEQSLQIATPQVTVEDLETVWYRDRLVNLTKLSTKQLREPMVTNRPITSFKIGVTLEVKDSLTWCHRVKKLTSTRHQSSIFKIAHGDMYTNDRLMRFGLRDNSNCDLCGNTDSRCHRIATCPKAQEIWNALRNLVGQRPIALDDPDNLKWVLGISDPINNELTIHAEVLQTLASNSKILSLPVPVILRIVLRKLYQLEKGQSRINIGTLLDKIGE